MFSVGGPRRRVRSLASVLPGLMAAFGVLSSRHWLMWALGVRLIAGLGRSPAGNELEPGGGR